MEWLNDPILIVAAIAVLSAVIAMIRAIRDGRPFYAPLITLISAIGRLIKAIKPKEK